MEMKYSRTEIHEFPNGVNIVYFPDLTEEERAARKEQLIRAARDLMMAVEATKERKKHEERVFDG